MCYVVVYDYNSLCPLSLWLFVACHPDTPVRPAFSQPQLDGRHPGLAVQRRGHGHGGPAGAVHERLPPAEAACTVAVLPVL